MSKTFPVRVVDGGRLITALSKENVGAADYTRKLNFRRVDDAECRREGYVKFFGEDGYVFDGTESVLKLVELVRPNGDRVVVGAGRTKLKRFLVDTGTWDDISGGLTFSSSGKRWQVTTGNGYLILNNAVDLPVSYRVEDDEVTQIKELRDVGYARVGRICEFNGFLEIGDLTRIKSDQLATWMNGYSNYSVGGTQTKNANFNVVFADHQDEFDVTTGASNIVATLPTLTFSQRMYIWLTKVDAGAGTVRTSPVIEDEEVVLDTIDDTALIHWNGQKWVAVVFAGGVIPAHDPYGTPPASITERYPWAVANSEFGEPTRWAPLFTSPMAAAGTSIVLPFNPSTWVANQTRVGVINAGPSGTTLGGQTGYEDGVLITAIGAFSASSMGVPITLEVTTDVVIAYPRLVQTTRWTDISTIVAEYRLVGDGSEIIGMDKLGELLVISRVTGFYVGRYTGDASNPFVFVPRYAGSNVPGWGDCIASVKGEVLVYPTIDGRFYQFDGISYPAIYRVCDDARELFFDGVTPLTECYVTDNPATKELWFFNGSLVLALDYEQDTVSEIDMDVGAGAWVREPDGDDYWFILAIGRFVYTYGLVTGVAPILTFLRDGEAVESVLKSGLIVAGDYANEKTILSYTPVLASSSADCALEVQLYSTYNPSAAMAALMDPVQELPTPEGENYFGTWFQAIYFMDEITIVDEGDVDCRISQRLIEFDRVGTGAGVTRRVTA